MKQPTTYVEPKECAVCNQAFRKLELRTLPELGFTAWHCPCCGHTSPATKETKR